MKRKKSTLTISENSKKRAQNLIVKLQLNSKQRKFCTEFIKDYHLENASARAGFTPTYGYKLILKKEIQRCIQLMQICNDAYTNLTEENLVGQMALWCNADITDYFDNNWNLKPLAQLTPEQRCCIQNIKCKVDRDGNTEVTLSLVDKMKANVNIGKTYGLYTPPKDISDAIDNMNEEELERFLNENKTL